MSHQMRTVLLPSEIEVVQYNNQTYDQTGKERESDNKYVYGVVKIKNCRNFVIGELFTKHQLEDFMETGINVTITG